MSFDKNQSGENFERNSGEKMPGVGHFSELYDSMGKIGSPNTEEEIRTLQTEIEPYKIIFAATKDVSKPVKVEGDLDVDAIADERLKAIATAVNEMDDVAKKAILLIVSFKMRKLPPILQSDLKDSEKKKKFEETVLSIETKLQELVTANGIPQALADQLKSKDTEEARVIVNMLGGYMPEGYVPPEHTEKTSTGEEMSEEYKAMIVLGKPVYRGGLFERQPAPRLSLEGIATVADNLAAIDDDKIAFIAAFLLNANPELLEKWIELIRRYHKISQELDTREQIKPGTELYGRVHSFMLRWNNVYGSDPNLHLDTVEQARDVINLFAGKTPERRPHDEIEDEREREFYENQRPVPPPTPPPGPTPPPTPPPGPTPPPTPPPRPTPPPTPPPGPTPPPSEDEDDDIPDDDDTPVPPRREPTPPPKKTSPPSEDEDDDIPE